MRGYCIASHTNLNTGSSRFMDIFPLPLGKGCEVTLSYICPQCSAFLLIIYGCPLRPHYINATRFDC